MLATAYDNENELGSSEPMQFTVLADEEAPELTVPQDISAVNTAGSCEATLDPGMASATDHCGDVQIEGERADGLALSAPYPVGETLIQWKATDAAGNSAEATQKVVVTDEEAPRITMSGYSPEIWPPNHQWHTFTLDQFIASATDNCTSTLDAYVMKITSDEASNAPGSGQTDEDILISDCQSFSLRAERSGAGNGRVYTIYFAVEDAHGNQSIDSATVRVPQNRGKKGAAVADEAVYEVQGCGTPQARLASYPQKGPEAGLSSHSEDQPGEADWLVYPNPVSDQVALRFLLSKAQEVHVSLLSLEGKILRTYRAWYEQGPNQWELGLHDIPSGTYMLRLESAGLHRYEKIVVHK